MCNGIIFNKLFHLLSVPGHQFRNYQLVDVLYMSALFIDELIKEIVAELYATKRSRIG